MGTVIDANTPLDYIEFQIFPGQNRYDAFVCYLKKKEKVTSGLLEHLLLHSAEAKALCSEGSSGSYKLTQPENANDISWFTKSTLIRFLHIIGLSNVLDVTNSVRNEMSQLEEARKFHLSLYTKGARYQGQSGESEDGCNGMTSTPNVEGSDASKNELLRAIDLRLTALEGELTAAFDQATGMRYSIEEMANIEKFCYYFGSTDLRDSLRKHIELRERHHSVDMSSSKLDGQRISSKEGNFANNVLSSETPVKYGVSPAKVAQVERQSSTESDESSFSNEEDERPVERSRPLIRSASPRRSASPMRRVQIGRSGSRRSTAITIKSLNYFPAREKSMLPKDSAANDSDEEGSEHPPRNVVRMSVKDAINLFESKQKDQNVDIQKAKSLLSASVGANKSVLRRWSSGMSEDSNPFPKYVSEDNVPNVQNDSESTQINKTAPEPEPIVDADDFPILQSGVDTKSHSPEGGCSPEVVLEEALPVESTNNEKLTASTEWNRKKEAELNELLMKMMETKPVKSRNVVPDSSKRQSLPADQRGGLYNHYKEKRDEKLRGQSAEKRSKKDEKYQGTQKVLDVKRSQVKAAKTSDASKKHDVKKLQKTQKNASQPANPKTESPKVGPVKKASTKASSLPAVRKSWPSLPSPRAPGPPPAKPPPLATTGTGTTRRRSQPSPPVSRPSPKLEASQPPTKSVKSNQVDGKIVKKDTEKKLNSVTKLSKTTKSKVQNTSEAPVSSAKPSLYSKVTKKGSVVPLESKPFLRKGSGGAKSKVSSHSQEPSNPEEPLRDSEDLIVAETNETVSSSSDPVQLQQIGTEEPKTGTCTPSIISAESPRKCEDEESFNPVSSVNDVIDRTIEPELKAEVEEESTISPRAWVEIEEHTDEPISSSDNICASGSPAFAGPVGVSSPRVRHSLSQMLLEESNEPDIVDWGNAENPPPMVFQKDAPKGLKRLLKFARKSKTDTSSTGWSSPSVFSEGEDDSEDSKFLNRRSSENLLKKATLHSKNNGHPNAIYGTNLRSSVDNEHPAQGNVTKFHPQTISQQLQDGHGMTSVTSTKATRSFFSLSAFKGGNK